MATASTLEQKVVRYRRWPYFVGGDSHGNPVAASYWGKARVHAPKKMPVEAVFSTYEESFFEIEEYMQRKITVGNTRFVLRVWVLAELGEAQALEMIWDQLMESVGA